jgi:hypothetical protein
MWTLWIALPIAAYLAPLLAAWRFADSSGVGPDRARVRDRWLAVLASIGLGLAAAAPVMALERWAVAATGVDPKAQTTGAWAAMLASLLIYAPLEEAAKFAASWPIARTRVVTGSRDGMVCASAIAAGFATVEIAFYLFGARKAGLLVAGTAGVIVIARVLLATVARLFCAAVWGYVLGRARARQTPLLGRNVLLALAAATATKGIYDHLAFGRGLVALLGVAPLFVGMVVVAVGAVRDFAPKALPSWHPSGRLSFLPSIPPPPSLTAMRDALKRAERPVMFRWIMLGALVTMGVIIACVVGSVYAGWRWGIDFGAVDEGEVTGMAPLVFIGLGVLFAFPVSGFLIARASAAESVLEPALSAAVAIAGTLVMLGLAEPVALVFAVAFAPIAFGLACVGAWVGIGGAR